MPTNDPAPLIAATPAGMDLGRIEQAMRLLAETALAEEARATAENGGTLPDYDGNPSARAVCLPLSTACRTAYSALGSHLVALIGHRDATQICQRIAHDVQDESAAFAAQPAQSRH